MVISQERRNEEDEDVRRNQQDRDQDSRQIQQIQEVDSWSFQGSENPGACLVSNPLNTENYIDWCRAMKISLAVKEKLDFIIGPSNKIEITDPRFKKWKKCDSMVLAWLINSISKDLSQSFLYCTEAKELWDESRLGESNEPLLYSIKKQISTIKQGNMSVMQYFLKIKQLWEDFAYIRPIPKCSYGRILQQLLISLEEDKVLQFLMGLSDCYDSVRSQILLLDPLPSVNKTYSMVIRVEKQRELNQDFAAEIANIAGQDSSSFPVLLGSDKEGKKCSHCGKSKHTRDECWKLNELT